MPEQDEFGEFIPVNNKIKDEFGDFIPANGSGIIKGQGTGKSDSITSTEQDGTLIVPTENVEKAKEIYKKYINKNIPLAEPSIQSDATTVKLSNGEFKFTPQDLEILKQKNVDISELLSDPLKKKELTSPSISQFIASPQSQNGSKESDSESQSTLQTNNKLDNSGNNRTLSNMDDVQKSTVNKLKEKTRDTFLSNDIFDKPENREFYYKKLKDLGYKENEINDIKNINEGYLEKKKEYKDLVNKVNTNPNDRDANYMLGLTELALDKPQDAIQSFQRTLANKSNEQPQIVQGTTIPQEVASKDDNALYGIGYAYSKLGNKQEAENYYKNALEVNPNNFNAKKGLALIEYSKGNKEIAKQLYNEGVDGTQQELMQEGQRYAVGESPSEIKQAQYANDISKVFGAIIEGDKTGDEKFDNLMKTINPISFARGYIDDTKELFKSSLENLTTKHDEVLQKEGRVASNIVAAKGLIDGAFGVMKLIDAPVMAGWDLGTGITSKIIGEKAVGLAMSPFTSLGASVNDSEGKKAALGMVDTIWQLALIKGLDHGISEPLANKFKNNEPLTQEEANKFIQITKEATPQEIKEAQSKVWNIDESDNISSKITIKPEIKTLLDQKKTLENALEIPEISAKTKQAYQEKINSIDEELKQKHEEHTDNIVNDITNETHDNEIKNQIEVLNKDLENAKSDIEKEVINEQINNLKNDTKEISKSVSQGINRENSEIDSRNEEIANELRGRIEKAREDFPIGERDGKESDTRKVDDKAIYDYAKENNLWINDFYELGDKFSGGTEHDIRINKDNQKLYKKNNLSNYNTIDNFLEKIKLHNEIFPNTPYKFEGFTGIEKGLRGEPFTEPVYSQDFIKDTQEATPNDISDYMNKLGFDKINESTFKKGNVQISDLKPRNVLKDKKGDIYVIDAEFKENNQSINNNLKPQENATKERIIKENNQQEHSNRNEIRKTPETSNSNSTIESREKQQEKIAREKFVQDKTNELTALSDEEYINKFIEDGHLNGINGNRDFGLRPNFGLDTKDVKKGIEDIKNGKNSAASRHLKERILETKNNGGEIDIITGTGGKSEKYRIPIGELYHEEVLLNEKDLNHAKTLPDNIQETIDKFDITLDNIDEIGKAWGFPKEEINTIKKHLQDETGINTEAENPIKTKTNADKSKELSNDEGKVSTEGEEKKSKLREEITKSLKQKEKNIFNALKPKFESTKNINKQSDNIVNAKFLPIRELLKGLRKISIEPLSKLQEATFGKGIDMAKDWVAKKIQEGITSSNKIKRWASQFVTSWHNVLPRTIEDLQEKKLIKGNVELSKSKFEEGMKQLHSLVNNDVTSLERIHQVLDPEFYKENGILFGEPVKYEDLSDNEKQLYETLKNINDYIHDWNFSLGMIDMGTYEKNKGNYNPRLYEPFELSAEMQGLLETNNINSEYVKKGKEKLKLLDDYVKARSEVDDFKKQNILRDPVYSTLKRMMQTEQNASVLSYIDYISKKRGLISKEPKEGFTQLNGKGYGKLNGAYVANYIAEDFKGYFFGNKIVDLLYDIGKLYSSSDAVQLIKKYHTIYSPSVQIGNASSNYLAFSVLSGIDPITMISNSGKAKKILKEKGDIYNLLLKHNVIGSNILQSDLIPLTKTTQEFALENKTKPKTLLQKVSNVDEALGKRYSKTDDIAKISAFLSFKDYGYSDAKAIKMLGEGFQNYSSVGKIWDLSSKIPIFGSSYVKFQADLQRILVNSALRRPLNVAMFVGLINVMNQLGSKLSRETDEEKQIREGRKYIPKLPLIKTPLVTQTPIGEINLARYISPLYNYDIGDSDSPIENVSRYTPFQIQVSESRNKGDYDYSLAPNDVLAGVWYAAIISDKDFRDKSIQDPTSTRFKSSGVTPTERVLNASNYILRSQVPLWSNANDMINSLKYGTDYYGRTKKPMNIILDNFIKINEFKDSDYKDEIINSADNIQSKIDDLTKQSKEANSLLDKELYKANSLLEDKKITSRQYDNIVNDISEKQQKRMAIITDKIAEQQEALNNFVDKYKNSKDNEISKLKLDTKYINKQETNRKIAQLEYDKIKDYDEEEFKLAKEELPLEVQQEFDYVKKQEENKIAKELKMTAAENNLKNSAESVRAEYIKDKLTESSLSESEIEKLVKRYEDLKILTKGSGRVLWQKFHDDSKLNMPDILDKYTPSKISE